MSLRAFAALLPAALLPAAVLPAALLAASPSAPAPLFADTGDPAAWRVIASDGVSGRLRQETGGHGLRLDVDFHGGAGYAIARRDLRLELPANFVLTFDLKSDLPPNNLEIKLVDPSGENVWWRVRRDDRFPTEWQAERVRKRQFEFAWGPAGGGEPTTIGAIEIAVSAGSGGQGSLWIDHLTITPADAEAEPAAPVASASGAESRGPELALDGDPATAWQVVAGTKGAASLLLDLGASRPLGGLVLDWLGGARPRRYGVQTSADGESWQVVRTVEAGTGERDYLYLPETEARFLRLRCEPGREGIALADLKLQPLAFGASRNAFVTAIAADLPRGRLPRAYLGEQSYWTVAGVDADAAEALVSEDGAVEVPTGAFSLEPFVELPGRLLSWADVAPRQELLDGSLPVPGVIWESGPLVFRVDALVTGAPGNSSLLVRYRLENRGDNRLPARLLLAVRPLEVNPPPQFLNHPGGVGHIRRLAFAGGTLRVDAAPPLTLSPAPDQASVLSFDQGSLSGFPAAYLSSTQTSVDDPEELAGGLAAFDLPLAPGAGAEVLVETVIAGGGSPLLARLKPERRYAAAEKLERYVWRSKLDRVRFTLPPEAADLGLTVRAALAQLLVNRDGPALMPGSRAYARSWIRDGALMAAALLRLGLDEPVKEYLGWYAEKVFASGKVPCCVDQRGADPVPENDSHGEFLYLAAETYRFTHDRALVERLWPRLPAVVGYLDQLRQERRTPAYQEGDGRRFFGLLPESISHEGYSAKPMHSFWDDFFAYRGLADAAFLAAELGRAEEAARWAVVRDELAADIRAAVARVIGEREIDYVPGCVELADFDPTSTTIALNPTGADALLPAAALSRTFERYLEESRARARGDWQGEAYTPYELRSVGALVRLGQPKAAREMLSFFLHDRRPLGWRQWPEVVWRDPRAAKFLGDLPHSWVASDFLRSFLDLFAYKRSSDHALVLGAGLAPSWLASPGGVGVEGLRTPYGKLTMAVAQEGAALRYRLAGDAAPPGGFVLAWPLDGSPGRVTIDGVGQRAGTEVRLDHLPAEVVIAP